MAKGRAVEMGLYEAEREALAALTRKHRAPQSLAVRARIVLAAANGLTNKEIAAKLGIFRAHRGRPAHAFRRRSP